MRTNEAKRTRDKALRDARKHGHDVTLISRGGALELYGCYNCNDVMDIWDSPAIVNGPMSHRACAGISRKQSWGARMLKIFFNPVSKTYHLMRKRITNIKEEEEKA
tara:strand:- start:366 stop:683 length:318 start_codon:yes stop_codon:yes gene_type:complete